MRIPTPARTFLLMLLFWASANALIYFGIEWLEAPKLPDKHRVSREALAAFSSSASRIDEADDTQHNSLAYRLMAPANVKSGRRYPLVVFLHGSAEVGDDNQAQLRGFPEQMAETAWRIQMPCFVLAPQCPEESQWTNLGDELTESIRGVMAQHPVDPRRVYLTGLSMGGYGCWMLASKEPDLFAAVVPICGGGDPTWAKRLINVPIWAVHGDADETVAVEQSRTMIDAIREQGGHPSYTELKGVGHNSWTQTYRDPVGVLKWMFEQRNERTDANSR